MQYGCFNIFNICNSRFLYRLSWNTFFIATNVVLDSYFYPSSSYSFCTLLRFYSQTALYTTPNEPFPIIFSA